MKITTAWCNVDDEEFVQFVDGYDDDLGALCGGRPIEYQERIDEATDNGYVVRELVIEVPDEAVRALFDVPEVEGKVTG